ncbi:MAG: hypothetical protein IKX54_04760 [Lachnospiraceae bacterium]|nr:hypothetical protein [Lachnospiraceae bacterium]
MVIYLLWVLFRFLSNYLAHCLSIIRNAELMAKKGHYYDLQKAREVAVIVED